MNTDDLIFMLEMMIERMEDDDEDTSVASSLLAKLNDGNSSYTPEEQKLLNEVTEQVKEMDDE